MSEKDNHDKKEKVSHKAPSKRTAPSSNNPRAELRNNKNITPSSGSNLEKYLKFAAVPAVAVILMLIIVFADKQSGKGDANGTGSSDVINLTESVQSDNNVYQNDFSDYELKKNAYPEINELMNTYFKALTDGDIETVKKILILGDGETFEKKEELMKSEGEYIEAYNNIDCYTKNGPEENSYVVYVAYDIKFLQMDTPVPGLARLYVVADEDSNYYIYSPYSSEVEAYMDEVDKSEDVVILCREIDEKVANALESDDKLRAFMEALVQGGTGETPASQSDEETTQDTQAAETTTAAN